MDKDLIERIGPSFTRRSGTNIDPDGGRVVTVDYERYARFLENADLSEEEKQAFLETLWSVILEFVSLGFGVHPLQQIEEGCGQEIEPGAAPTGDSVYSPDIDLNTEFERAEQSERVERILE
ncbi:MAG: hypothetical protein AAFQ67_09575 [Pseudomonadota bacterium]